MRANVAFLAADCESGTAARCVAMALVWLGAGLGDLSHAARADSAAANGPAGNRLRAEVTSQGWCRVDYVVPAEVGGETNTGRLRLTRECETGEQLPLGEGQGMAGGTHSWVDRAPEKGRTYTYTADYSGARFHESEVLVVYVPRKTDESPVSASDPLFVEVYGTRVQGRGGVFMLEARPSIPGGTFTWTPINVRAGPTLAISAGRALLRSEQSNAGWHAMWRMEYRVGRLHWTQIVNPSFWGVVWFPLMSVPGGTETIEKLRKDPLELRNIIEHDFNPSNENDLARDSASYLLSQVGEPALPVLAACYRDMTDSLMQNAVLLVMLSMSNDYTVSNLQARVFESDDLLQIQTLLDPKLKQTCALPAVDLRRELTVLIHHPDPCVRWLLAEHLRFYRSVRDAAAAILDEMKTTDPSAGVRWKAARSAQALRQRHDKTVSDEIRETTGERVPVSVADVALAGKLLEAAVEEIRTGPPGKHLTKFAVLGGGGFTASESARPNEPGDLNWYVSAGSPLARLALMPEGFLAVLEQKRPQLNGPERDMIVRWMSDVHEDFKDDFEAASEIGKEK